MLGFIVAAVVVIVVLIVVLMRRRPAGVQGLDEAQLQARYPEDIAFMKETLGIDISTQLEYVKAALYVQDTQGVSFRELYNSSDEVARSFWQGVGQSYADDGDHIKATECFVKALAICVKGENQDLDAIAALHCSLGVAFREMGEHDKAIDLFEKSLAHHEDIGRMESPEVAILLHNLGWAWHGKGDEGKARAYYEQALALCRKIDLAEGIETVTEKMQKLQ